MKPNPAWASLPLLDRTGWKRVWFGKRRAYQRKVAVAEFEAVVSGDIDVLTAWLKSSAEVRISLRSLRASSASSWKQGREGLVDC